jgi:glycosyltransferase involved in cell wall biosynthesis
MKQNVKDIWVYSNYLKTCYEKSGIPSEMIHIIPPGIDSNLFNPNAPAFPPFKNLINNRFCFFYNGGVTLRKGTDILVNAFLNEFSADENVCLIIKDSFSYGKELALKIQNLSLRTDIAKIHYILQNFSHEDLPSLYQTCDCYVHPYRAEGFGLPVAEAMACCKPVITTGYGSTVDFISSESGFLVDSTVEYMKNKSISGFDTVDYPFWAVPDLKHLQILMRYVYEHYDEAKVKATVGRNEILGNFSIKIAALKAEKRIQELFT